MDSSYEDVIAEAAPSGPAAALRRWCIAGAALVAAGTLIGLMLTLRIQPGRGATHHVIGAVLGVGFSLFIYWQISLGKNWARRLFIILTTFNLLTLPLLWPFVSLVGKLTAHPALVGLLYGNVLILTCLFRIAFSFYLFTPPVRALFLQTKPDPAERTILGVIAAINLAAGLLLGFVAKTWLKAITVKDGRAVVAPWVAKNRDEQSQKIRRRAEWLSGYKLPDWGTLAGAKAVGDFSVIQYHGFNPKQTIYLFCAPAAQPFPLPKMLEQLDVQEARERMMTVSGEKIENVARGSWALLESKVIQTTPLAVQNGPLSAQRLFLPKQAQYQDGYLVSLTKGEKLFTVLAISSGGAFSEAALIDFLNQLSGAAAVQTPGVGLISGHTPKQLLDQGRRNLQFAHYPQAIFNFQKAIQLDPDSREAYELLVQAYTDNNEFDKAQQITLEIKKRWP